MKIEEAIKAIKEGSKRNFVQSIDMIINLKNIDLRKPENKISKEITLPHSIRSKANVCVISDSIQKSEKFDVIGKIDLTNFEGDKKKAKGFAKKYDFFLAEAPLMLAVGKSIGRYLGPLGKMPMPIPPNIKNIDGLAESKNKAVKIRVRDSPVIHTMIGKENMNEEQLIENGKKILEETEKTLPKGRAQIRNIYIKTTMGTAQKIEW
ncbi:MAG TPA: 50S ribosomal protein L1 [archaeon]|nr:50S ribosomal protein L1 [archaeon]